MSNISIEDLGLSKEELAERVVNRAAELLLNEDATGDVLDGEESELSLSLADALQGRVTAKIDEAVENVAARNVLPNVESYVENFCLQKTNEWGEKRAEPVTFTEYLTHRAEAYITEKVDFDGRTKAEARGFGWSPNQTRISHMIDNHLQFHISVAVRNALADLNSKVSEGIAATVRAQLKQTLDRLKIDVKK